MVRRHIERETSDTRITGVEQMDECVDIWGLASMVEVDEEPGRLSRDNQVVQRDHRIPGGMDAADGNSPDAIQGETEFVQGHKVSE